MKNRTTTDLNTNNNYNSDVEIPGNQVLQFSWSQEFVDKYNNNGRKKIFKLRFIVL